MYWTCTILNKLIDEAVPSTLQQSQPNRHRTNLIPRLSIFDSSINLLLSLTAPLKTMHAMTEYDYGYL